MQLLFLLNCTPFVYCSFCLYTAHCACILLIAHCAWHASGWAGGGEVCVGVGGGAYPRAAEGRISVAGRHGLVSAQMGGYVSVRVSFSVYLFSVSPPPPLPTPCRACVHVCVCVRWFTSPPAAFPPLPRSPAPPCPILPPLPQCDSTRQGQPSCRESSKTPDWRSRGGG